MSWIFLGSISGFRVDVREVAIVCYLKYNNNNKKNRNQSLSSVCSSQVSGFQGASQ